MKILLDQNISYHAIRKLAKQFDEIAQIGRLGMAQTDDAMIWQYARTHRYVLVTFDNYFKERNILSGHPIKIILLKFENTTPDFVIKTIKKNIKAIRSFYEDDNWACLELHDNE